MTCGETPVPQAAARNRRAGGAGWEDSVALDPVDLADARHDAFVEGDEGHEILKRKRAAQQPPRRRARDDTTKCCDVLQACGQECVSRLTSETKRKYRGLRLHGW